MTKLLAADPAAALFRNTIGHLNALQQFHATRTANNYPPYNVELVGADPDRFRITLAVAGFTRDEIAVTLHDGMLTVTGAQAGKVDDSRFLHRGIALRDFEQQFKLDQWIVVTGAGMADGLLTVDLERRVPEERKPRVIAIT